MNFKKKKKKERRIMRVLVTTRPLRELLKLLTNRTLMKSILIYVTETRSKEGERRFFFCGIGGGELCK